MTVEKIKKQLLFVKDFIDFRNTSKKDGRFSVLWKDKSRQSFDNTGVTPFDRHYTYHPAWAIRTVKKINPSFHTDISSILSFSTMLSAFIPVDFYDYRPADITLSGLHSKQADLVSLPFKDESVSSLSCMHTVEHVGLGRYGEPIDPSGDLKAIDELKRVLAVGGSLLFVVPIGKPKICYNAHRIYSYKQIREYFSELNLKEFSLIPENSGGIIEHATEEQADAENYGCGCFWFTKIKK